MHFQYQPSNIWNNYSMMCWSAVPMVLGLYYHLFGVCIPVYLWLLSLAIPAKLSRVCVSISFFAGGIVLIFLISQCFFGETSTLFLRMFCDPGKKSKLWALSWVMLGHQWCLVPGLLGIPSTSDVNRSGIGKWYPSLNTCIINKESPENACVQEQTMFWLVLWNISYFPENIWE